MHQTKSLPHTFRTDLVYESRQHFIIHVNSIKERLLPFPYKIDCYSYGKKSGVSNPYKSRGHCILELMKHSEYKKCKRYRKWFYRSLNETKFDKIDRLNNCLIGYNENILNQRCKKNCYNEYYKTLILAQLSYGDNDPIALI